MTYKSAPRSELRSTIIALPQVQINTPVDLTNIDKKQAIALDQSLFTRGTVTLLWQFARCQFEYPKESTAKHFHRDPLTLTRFIDKIQGKSIIETKTAQEFNDIATKLGLPANFDQITPVGKAKLLKNAPTDRPLITRYPTLGAEINILRTAKASLPSARSGVASYMGFCQLLGRPSSPRPKTQSNCGGPHLTGASPFGDLQKASILMAHNTNWLTPAARALSKGLENAQDLSFKFPKFHRIGRIDSNPRIR